MSNNNQSIFCGVLPLVAAPAVFTDLFLTPVVYSNNTEMFFAIVRRYDVMGMLLFILAVRLGYLYALKYVRHLNR